MSGKHSDELQQSLADQSHQAQSKHRSCSLDATQTETCEVYTSCAAIGNNLETILAAAVTEMSSRASMQSEEVLQRVKDLRKCVE